MNCITRVNTVILNYSILSPLNPAIQNDGQLLHIIPYFKTNDIHMLCLEVYITSNNHQNFKNAALVHI